MKILKFGAVWCSGCLVMKPRLEEINKEHEWLEIDYIDYDDDKEEVTKWAVKDILPTFIFIDKDGNEIVRLFGEKKKQELVNLILEHKDK